MSNKYAKTVWLRSRRNGLFLAVPRGWSFIKTVASVNLSVWFLRSFPKKKRKRKKNLHYLWPKRSWYSRYSYIWGKRLIQSDITEPSALLDHPTGLSTYISLARGAKSIIKTRRAAKASFTPQHCSTHCHV